MTDQGYDTRHLLEQQNALLVEMKNTQDDVAEKFFAFMRVTVDIQEVMLRRLNVLAFITTALTVLAVIGVFALLSQ